MLSSLSFCKMGQHQIYAKSHRRTDFAILRQAGLHRFLITELDIAHLLVATGEIRRVVDTSDLQR